MPVEFQSIVGTICVVGSHGAPAAGKVCLAGKVTELPPPSTICLVGEVHQRDVLGKIALKGAVHQRSVESKLAIRGEVHQRSIPGTLCLVGVVRELAVPIGPHPIGSSTPTGVLPQTGSAIFTKWEQVSSKDVLVHRHWDFHEGARVKFDDTRRAWRLEMEVGASKHNDVADFFESHVWAGKAFYFYDLQSNGYQYDATGVLTTGRYKVRFVDEDFPRVYSVGERFRIPFSVIECE